MNAAESTAPGRRYRIAALVVLAVVALGYGALELRQLMCCDAKKDAAFGWCGSKCSNIFGGRGGRDAWESAIKGNSPSPNGVRRVEDPSLVRKLREAAGASSAVAVAVTVFDAGDAGNAVAVQIEPDDAVGYLRDGKYGSVEKAVERSGVRAWFVAIYEDGDDVFGRLEDRSSGGESGEAWARWDLGDCLRGPTSSEDNWPPCPVDLWSTR